MNGSKKGFTRRRDNGNKVICIHFQRGSCTYGQACKFSHDLTSQGHTRPRRNAAPAVKDPCLAQYKILLKQNSPQSILRPDATSASRFFDLGLQILDESTDADAKQDVIELLGTEEGLAYIRDVAGKHIPAACSSGTRLMADTWDNQVCRLFRIVTHSTVTGSAILEDKLAVIINFLYGVGGSRMSSFFRFAVALAKAPARPSPPSSIAVAGLSLAVLAQILEVNPNAMIDDSCRRFAEEFGALIKSETSSPEDEFTKLQADKHEKYIRRRLAVGESLPDSTQAQQALPLASLPAFQLREDFPGHLSADGPRHSNDHADIANIALLPDCDEIMCTRSEYLPTTDSSQWHCHGLRGRLDREYRLLREDAVGPIRDALRAEIQSLRHGGGSGMACQTQRHNNKSGTRYCTYPGADIFKASFGRRTGLDFVVRFQQPARFRTGDADDGSSRQENKEASLRQRREWWTRAKKRLQPGGLVCAIGAGLPVLFFTVSELTLRTAHDAAVLQRMMNMRRIQNDKIDDKLTLADDPDFSFVGLRLPAREVSISSTKSSSGISRAS